MEREVGGEDEKDEILYVRDSKVSYGLEILC